MYITVDGGVCPERNVEFCIAVEFFDERISIDSWFGEVQKHTNPRSTPLRSSVRTYRVSWRVQVATRSRVFPA